jgi:hypothetical protein
VFAAREHPAILTVRRDKSALSDSENLSRKRGPTVISFGRDREYKTSIVTVINFVLAEFKNAVFVLARPATKRSIP